MRVFNSIIFPYQSCGSESYMVAPMFRVLEDVYVFVMSHGHFSFNVFFNQHVTGNNEITRLS